MQFPKKVIFILPKIILVKFCETLPGTCIKLKKVPQGISFLGCNGLELLIQANSSYLHPTIFYDTPCLVDSKKDTMTVLIITLLISEHSSASFPAIQLAIFLLTIIGNVIYK
jgi:hypothetical protein